jgi:hypothetical protein
MDKSVLTAIIFYTVVMGLIFFAKPDFLYNHNENKWKEGKYINLTSFSILIGALIYLYVSQTE